jgi:hypothetical protein
MFHLEFSIDIILLAASARLLMMDREPVQNMLSSITYLLTYSMEHSPSSLEIPCIYGTRKFITVLTSARHLSLS